MGHHGRGRRRLHGLRRVSGSPLPRALPPSSIAVILLQSSFFGRPRMHWDIIDPPRPDVRRLKAAPRSAARHQAPDLTVEFTTRRGVVARSGRSRSTCRSPRAKPSGIVCESGSEVGGVLCRDAHSRPRQPSRGLGDVSGMDVRRRGEEEVRRLRGREMSMIFQNPRAALKTRSGRSDARSRTCWRRARQGGLHGRDRQGHRDCSTGAQAARGATTPTHSSCPAACAQRSSSRSSSPCRPQLLIARSGRPPVSMSTAEGGDGLGGGAHARARHVHDPDHPRSRPCARPYCDKRCGNGEGDTWSRPRPRAMIFKRPRIPILAS